MVGCKGDITAQAMIKSSWCNGFSFACAPVLRTCLVHAVPVSECIYMYTSMMNFESVICLDPASARCLCRWYDAAQPDSHIFCKIYFSGHISPNCNTILVGGSTVQRPSKLKVTFHM